MQPKLQFTIEIEKDHILLFLDVSEILKQSIHIWFIYRNDFYMRVPYNSFCPLSRKQNSISGLKYRKNRIFFPTEVENEFKNIKNYL